MCGLDGESGVNFEKFTSRIGIVDRGATILGLHKTP